MWIIWLAVIFIVICLIAAAGSNSGSTNTQIENENKAMEIDFYDSLNLHPEKEFRCKTTNGDIYSVNLLHSEKSFVIVNITTKYVIKLNYSDILKCDVQQDNSTITESSAGAALTGLIFFGVEGAIVGASSKSSKDVCSNLSIRIITRDILNPNIIIPLIQSSVNRQSAAYRNLIQFADDVYSTIMAIIGMNNQQQMSALSYNMLSQPINSMNSPALNAPTVNYQNQIIQQSEQSVLYDVVLKDAGEKKINTIKVIKELASLGLVEAKEIAEIPGSRILSNVSRETAVNARLLLNNAGAVVDVVPHNFIANIQPVQFTQAQNIQTPFFGQTMNISENFNMEPPSNNYDNDTENNEHIFQQQAIVGNNNTNTFIPDLSAQLPSSNQSNNPIRRAAEFTWNSSNNNQPNRNNDNK